MKLVNNLIKSFYWVLICILGVILIYTTIEFIVLVIRTILNNASIFDFNQDKVSKDELFLVHVQGLIAAVLLITIILELIQSLLTYLKTKQHGKYLIILYEIALIAVIRHLFVLDFHHVDGINIIGLSLLILIIGVLNFINKPGVIQKIANAKSQK